MTKLRDYLKELVALATPADADRQYWYDESGNRSASETFAAQRTRLDANYVPIGQVVAGTVDITENFVLDTDIAAELDSIAASIPPQVAAAVTAEAIPAQVAAAVTAEAIPAQVDAAVDAAVAAAMPVVTAWTNVTFLNGWSNLDALNYPGGQYRKVGDNVEIRGMITGGTLPAVAFTLPAGFRPPRLNYLSTTTSTGPGIMLVGADGAFQPQSGSNGWFVINCTFSVTP